MIRVLISSAFPEHLNRNVNIINSIVEGFGTLIDKDNVMKCSYQDIAQFLEETNYDIVLLIGSCMPDVVDYTKIKKLCKQYQTKLCFWLHDDPYEFDFAYRVEQVADYIFSNDSVCCQHYSHPNVFHLPLAASEMMHFRPIKIQPEYDLFFCGYAYPNRIRFFETLYTQLLQFKCCILGDGWPSHLKGLCENERIDNEAFIDYCNNSLVTLNLGRNFDLANKKYSISPSTPGPRTFEAAMAGAVQAYYVDSLEIMDYFNPNQQILLFDSCNDLIEIIQKLKNNPQRSQSIRLASQKKAQSCHTYTKRVEKLLGIVIGSNSLKGLGE